MMFSDHSYDVLVVGAGLVGSSCAIALARSGLKVGLLDKRVLTPFDKENDSILLDSRVYTLTPGNAAWLESLGIWQRLDRQRVSFIDEMEIWGDQDAEASTAPTLEFSAHVTEFMHMAFVVEEKVLRAALWSALPEAGVEIINGDCADLEARAHVTLLRLSSGIELQARLVVAADGANSAIRSLAGIAMRSQAYEQQGVVANFEAELPHRHIARQWFMREGVMAWLPLPGNRISMVWSTQNAAELLQLDAAALAEKVAGAGGRILGPLKTVTPAQAFPLALQAADAMIQPRLALIGDAAHQIHPLAGQGVNLGFRDAIVLAEILGSRKQQEDLGSYMLLRRYERARKTDLLEMQLVTHGLHMLFDSDRELARVLRNWGMKALNHQSLLKRQLIRQAV
jgi:2-polyprenylphenol 6-hydroxylase